MRNIRILYIMDDGQRNSPVRYYRGDLPLERLAKTHDAEIMYPVAGIPIWRDLVKADVVFFMRCHSEQHLEIAHMAKRQGVKVWYDIDDNLFEVPRSNPNAFPVYNNPMVQGRIQQFLQLSDVVTVSTKALGEYLKDQGCAREYVIIPNALDEKALPSILRPYAYENESQNKVFTWRGGVTHMGDLMHYAKAIEAFLKSEEDAYCAFAGFNPFWIVGEGVLYSAYVHDYFSFMEQLKDYEPWAHFVPLEDNQFNRSKSDIAALEAIYAGALPVLPDWDEWDIPGAFKYTAGMTDDFGAALEEAYEIKPEDRLKNVELARVWVVQNRILSVTNLKRWEILQELVK